jgi:hypothetical protein
MKILKADSALKCLSFSQEFFVFQFAIQKYLFTYLLPDSLHEAESSWEANQLSTSQKFPHILWNPKVLCRLYKWPPLVPSLNKINQVHAPPSPIPLPADSF